MEISERNSTKLCQTVGAIALTNCCKIGDLPSQNWAQNIYYWCFFDDFKT